MTKPSRQDRVGVLLVQLGTPDAPDAPSVRRYLAEFLSDRRVVDLPRATWWPLLHGVILRTRPRRSAALYRKVWTAAGSPLLVHTRAQAGGVAERLAARHADRVHVAFGMRYGNPTLAGAIDELVDAGCRRLLVLPLYPQNGSATTASTFDAVTDHLRRGLDVPGLRFVASWADHPAYVGALASRTNEALAALAFEPERLLISFHGEPQRYVEKGDPYQDECERTATALATALELPADHWKLVYQSRFGPAEWLRPYLDETVAGLAKEGVRDLAVVLPGFVADCLETIDEVGREVREAFEEAGGRRFAVLPGLNDHEPWLDALTEIVDENLRGWV